MPTDGQFGRRTFLKSAGASISIGAIGVASGAKPENTVELVTAKRGDKVIETTKVPKAWYEYEQRAERTREQLLQDRLNSSGITSVELAPSDETVGSYTKSKIRAVTTPVVTSSTIPNALNDVPIETAADPNYQLLSHGSCHNERQYNQIYGGVEMGPPGGGYGTCATVVQKPSGKQFMLHADHVWSTCGGDVGEAVDQSGQRVGRIWGQSSTYDYTLVERTNGPPYFYPGIRTSNDGNRHRVQGRKTYSGLKTTMHAGDYIYKQGVTSGFNRGKITGLGAGTNEGCISYENNGIRCRLNVASGDSGGPIFTDVSGSKVKLAGHVSVGYDKTSQESGCNGANLYNYIIGSPFYKIHQRGNFTIEY